MEDFDFDGELELDESEGYGELDEQDARDLEASLAALDRRGGVEAAFRAVMREELGGDEL
jgi:hypothetical protein